MPVMNASMKCWLEEAAPASTMTMRDSRCVCCDQPRCAAISNPRPPAQMNIRRSITESPHLIRAQQHGLRYPQSESLRGNEVDNQLELGRLLDREIAGLRAFEYSVDKAPRIPIGVRDAG